MEGPPGYGSSLDLGGRQKRYGESLPPGALKLAVAVARAEYFNGLGFASPARPV